MLVASMSVCISGSLYADGRCCGWLEQPQHLQIPPSQQPILWISGSVFPSCLFFRGRTRAAMSLGRAFLLALVVTATAFDQVSHAGTLYVNGNVTAPCESEIYCHGELLQTVQLARVFADSKTFVDLPTKLPYEAVLENFAKLVPRPTSNDSRLQRFILDNFGTVGGELRKVDVGELQVDPHFLDQVVSPTIRDFTMQVVKLWPNLTREYVGGKKARRKTAAAAQDGSGCDGCVSSFLALERPFVVAGGRFREAYYWDSYWIMLGLLRTRGRYTTIAKNMIENLLDFVDRFGFVPNGARSYYLSRSQPPILAQMVRDYVEYTNDTSLLDRAIPLLVREYGWWMTNRTVDVAASNGKTYTLNQYHVPNTQPRPESYREDYNTANNDSFVTSTGRTLMARPLSDSEKALLYSNLASGAESGWDFSSRWLASPVQASSGQSFALRSINMINIVPVDLNSILYWNEMTLAGLCKRSLNGHMAGNAGFYEQRARDRSEAMHVLMWNESSHAYFDWNLTSRAQHMFVPATAGAPDENDALAKRPDPPIDAPGPDGRVLYFHPAQFYPFWTGAADPSIKNNASAVLQAFERVDERLRMRDGGIAASNIRTNEQWDRPNVWPPMQHVLMQGLLNTPDPGAADASRRDAFVQTRNLALRIGQRYLDSTFCTWRATGGATADLARVPEARDDSHGLMFEKYSEASTAQVGGGGEYTVVTGFGWTNGVLIWTVDTFAHNLATPQCPDLARAARSYNHN